MSPIAEATDERSAAREIAGEYVDRMPVDMIRPSTTNPRTHFDPAYIDDLATSISDKGLIQPIIVREREMGTAYEIVAGECRWRAAQKAGLPHLAAIVRDYSDEQVLELQLVENLHRTDLTPLEQAVGYRRLIDTNPTKHSAETIATRIGMSPAYVWDRLKLNDLIPDAKQLLEQARISVGHAIVIARLKPADQARVITPDETFGASPRNASGLWQHDGGFDFPPAPAKGQGPRAKGKGKREKADRFAGFKPKSIRELEKWITDHVRFDVEHAAQAEPLQFEPLAQRVEQAAAKPGRGKKVVAITFEHFVQPEARGEGERTFGPRAFKFADGHEHPDSVTGKTAVAPVCDDSVLGVVAAGDQYGQAFEVCVARDKCQVHWKREQAEREKARKQREAGGSAATESDGQRKARERHEQQEQREQAQRKAWDEFKPKALAAFAQHVKKQRVTAALIHLAFQESYRITAAERFTGKLTDANVGQVLAVLAVRAWDRNVFAASTKPFKFNLAALERELEKAAKREAARVQAKKR